MKTSLILICASCLTACGVFDQDSGARCSRVNFGQMMEAQAQETLGQPLDPGEFVDFLGSGGYGWTEDAVLCEVGDLIFVAPADGSNDGFMVFDGDLRVLRDQSSLAVQDSFDLHTYLNDRNDDGHFDIISYGTWKYQGERHLYAMDWNIDGQPDYRGIELEDGSGLREAWVEGGWRKIGLEDGMHLLDEPQRKVRKDAEGNLVVVEEPTD